MSWTYVVEIFIWEGRDVDEYLVWERVIFGLGPIFYKILGFIIMAPACCWLSRCILALTVII
jgi:hypothetical protein